MLVLTRFRQNDEVCDVERFEHDARGQLTHRVTDDNARAPISSRDFDCRANVNSGAMRNPEGLLIRGYVAEFKGDRPVVFASFEANAMPLARNEFEYRAESLVGTVAACCALDDPRFHRRSSSYGKWGETSEISRRTARRTAARGAGRFETRGIQRVRHPAAIDRDLDVGR